MKIKGLAMVLLLAVMVVFYLLIIQGGDEGESALQKEITGYTQAKVKTTRANMRSLARFIDGFIATQDRFPENLNQVSRYQPVGNARYDSWGTPIKLEAKQSPNYILISAGPDQTFSTGDDIRLEF